MKKTILIALTAAAAAISVLSCNKETLPPVTGVSFQMDSVAFWGSEPGLIIKSRTRGLEVTLSVLIDGKTAFCDAEPYAIGEDGCDTLRIDEPLGIGEHTLHADYSQPYLKEGALISLLAIGIFVYLCIRSRRKMLQVEEA